MLKKIKIHKIAFFILLPFIINAQTQWEVNGINIGSSYAPIPHHKTVSDGNGGFYIVWEDNRYGDYEIYAQWIDGSGQKRWNNGILVSGFAGNQRYPGLAADGAGGIFIAWQNEATGRIFVQHLNAQGTATGTENGFLLSDGGGNQTRVKIIADGNGGAIFIWLDKRNGPSNDLYAQRLDASLHSVWPAGGIAVCSASEDQSNVVITGDGNGGFFAAWQDRRNENDYNIYAQHIRHDGTASWVSNGLPVSIAPNSQTNPVILRNTHSIVIAWQDRRNDKTDIYAQSVSDLGDLLWTANGVPVCISDGDQYNPKIAADGNEGSIIVWDDWNSYNIHAQRMDSAGNPVWAQNGLTINDAPRFQINPEIISDHAGGAFIAWNDYRSSTYDLYAQHVSGDGSLSWGASGMPVAESAAMQQNPVLISDGSGGVLAVWQDARNNNTRDLYAQLMNITVNIVKPEAEKIYGRSENIAVEWTLTTPDIIYNHLTFSVSETPGDDFPISAGRNDTPAAGTFLWTPDSITGSMIQIQVQAYNSEEILLGTFYSEIFQMDSDPPLPFDLIAPANSAITDSVPVFEWEEAVDHFSGISHYELWINGSLTKDSILTNSFALSEEMALTDGLYSWKVKAVDAVGNKISSNETQNFRVNNDDEPPEPFFLMGPDDNIWINTTDMTFTWTSTVDHGSGLKKYRLVLNNEIAVPYISPTLTSWEMNDLPVGSNIWRIEALDSLGNVRETESRYLHVDTVPPQPFSLTQPADDAWINNNTPVFSWTAAVDTGIGTAKYQLFINNLPVMDNLPPGLLSVELPAESALSDGNHTWHIKALDSLGNIRESSVFKLNVDTQAPEKFSIKSPANHAVLNDAKPGFSWKSAEDNISSIAQYQLWINNELAVDNIQDTEAAIDITLDEGTHLWFARAFDMAGNWTNSDTASFLVDITPPEPLILISPSDNETVRTAFPDFKWHSADDELSGFDYYAFFINGQLINAALGYSDTTITAPSFLENGNYTWKVKAADKAGNIRISEYRNFTIERNPPKITSPAHVKATEHELFTYTAEYSDPNDDPVTISFADVPSWLTQDGYTLRGIAAHTTVDTSFLVIASDITFKDTLKVNVEIIHVNDPPEISEIENREMLENTSIEGIIFYIGDEETPADELLCTYNVDNTVLFAEGSIIISGSGSERTVSLYPAKDQYGTAKIEIIVSDGELQDTTAFLCEVILVNQKPAIKPIEDQSVLQGHALNIPVEIDDRETPAEDLLLTVSFSDSELISDDGIVISGEGSQRLITLTPKERSHGHGALTIMVSDGELDSILNVSVHVIYVNTPPEIVSPQKAEAAERMPFLYKAIVEDPDDDEITILFNDLPAWLTQSADSVFGITPKGAKDTLFTVIANDGLDSDTLIVNLKIIWVNDPPEFITPLPNPLFENMDSLHYVINLHEYASDPDHPDSLLSWSCKILDRQAVNISISGWPFVSKIKGPAFEGDLRILFTVKDPEGLSVSDTLHIQSTITTDVEDNSGKIIPSSYKLYNNYPNPFNPITNIRYDISEPGHVLIRIFNMMGQQIDVLADHKQLAGTYELVWNANNRPSGMYILQMKTKNYTKAYRMLLLK